MLVGASWLGRLVLVGEHVWAGRSRLQAHVCFFSDTVSVGSRYTLLIVVPVSLALASASAIAAAALFDPVSSAVAAFCGLLSSSVDAAFLRRT